jgi:5-hydroxyisourate hydrolase
MSQITTHVLDTSRGRPAANLPVTLFQNQGDDWHSLATGVTNQDGRIGGLLSSDTKLAAGIYRMHFNTKAYFDANQEKGFYPYVDIVFELDASGDHYHIPLLLSAYGYSTYRGS